MSLHNKVENVTKKASKIVKCLETLPAIKSRTVDSKGKNSREDSVSAKDTKVLDGKNDDHYSHETNETIPNKRKHSAECELESWEESSEETSLENKKQKNEEEKEENCEEKISNRRKLRKQKKERRSSSIVFSSIILDNNVNLEKNTNNSNNTKNIEKRESNNTSKSDVLDSASSLDKNNSVKSFDKSSAEDKKSKDRTSKVERVINSRVSLTNDVMIKTKAMLPVDAKRAQKNQEREKVSRSNNKRSEDEQHHDEYTSYNNKVKSEHQLGNDSNTDNVVDDAVSNNITSKKSEICTSNANNDKRVKTTPHTMKKREQRVKKNSNNDNCYDYQEEYYGNVDADVDGKEDMEDNLLGAHAFSSPEFSEIKISPESSSSSPQYTAPSLSVRKEEYYEYERSENQEDKKQHRHRKNHHNNHHHHRHYHHTPNQHHLEEEESEQEEEMKSKRYVKQNDSKERRRRTHAGELPSPSALVTKRRAESLNPDNAENVAVMLKIWERKKERGRGELLEEQNGEENEANGNNMIKNKNYKSDRGKLSRTRPEKIIKEQDLSQSKAKKVEKCKKHEKQEQQQHEDEEKIVSKKTNDKEEHLSQENESEKESEESKEFDLPTPPPWPCGLSLRNSLNTTKQNKEEKTTKIVEKQTNRVIENTSKVNDDDDDDKSISSCNNINKDVEEACDHSTEQTFVPKWPNVTTPEASKPPVVWVANKLIPAPSVKVERTENSDFDSNVNNDNNENETKSSASPNAPTKQESSSSSNKGNNTEINTDHLQCNVHTNQTNIHHTDITNSIFSALDRIMENEQQLEEQEQEEEKTLLPPPFPGHNMFHNKYHSHVNTPHEVISPHRYALPELSQRSAQHRSRPTRVAEVVDEREVQEPPAWLREINRHIARMDKSPDAEEFNESPPPPQHEELSEERASHINNNLNNSTNDIKELNIVEFNHGADNVETQRSNNSSTNSSTTSSDKNVKNQSLQKELDNIPPWVIHTATVAITDTNTSIKSNKLVSEKQEEHHNEENVEEEKQDNVINTVICTDSNVNSYVDSKSNSNRVNSWENNLISILQRQSELTPLSQRKGFSFSNTRTNSTFTVPSISMENSLTSFSRRLHDNSLNSDHINKLLMISSNYGDSNSSSNNSSNSTNNSTNNNNSNDKKSKNNNNNCVSSSFTHTNSLSLMRSEKLSALQNVQPHYAACASIENSPFTSEHGSLMNIFASKSLKQAESAVECPERALPQWLAFTLPNTSPPVQVNDKKQQETQEEEFNERQHSNASEEQSQTSEEEDDDVENWQASLPGSSITLQTKEFIFSSGHLANKDNESTCVKPHTSNNNNNIHNPSDYVSNYSRGKSAFSNLSLSSMDLCKLPIVRPVLLDPTRRAESNNCRSDNCNVRLDTVNGKPTSVKTNNSGVDYDDDDECNLKTRTAIATAADKTNSVQHVNRWYDWRDRSENRDNFLLPVKTATSPTLSAMVNELVDNVQNQSKETHTEGNEVSETESLPQTRPLTSVFHSLETDEISELLNSIQEFSDHNTDINDNSKISIGSTNTHINNKVNTHTHKNDIDKSNIVVISDNCETDIASECNHGIKNMSYMRSGFPWAAVREVNANTYNSSNSGADHHDVNDDSVRSSNSSRSSTKSVKKSNADEATTDANAEENKLIVHASSLQEKQENAEQIEYEEERYLQNIDSVNSISDYFSEELAKINSFNDTC